MQKGVIMFVSLAYAEEVTISDETAEFHTGDKVIPFFEDEFVFYWWEWWEAVVVGVVEVVGDEVVGFEEQVDVFWSFAFQSVGCGYPQSILESDCIR